MIELSSSKEKEDVIDLEPTSGVQEKLVPERVVGGLPTMYCFETCPFCFKVKALLGTRGIEYSKVEVDPTFKTQLKWSDWSAVPVLPLSPERTCRLE